MPPIDNAERMRRIRARAQAHNEELEAATWFKPGDLAARWKLSVTTVYEIPRDELPYKPFGSGSKREHRRYSPAAVAAFEAKDTRYSKAS